MDVHIVPGVKAKDVAEAHQKDIFHQEEHACKCMTYWIDEQRESIFCLIEAPSKDAVVNMHNQAHGLVPNKVIEVNSGLVESFLGRLYDPVDAPVSEGLKVFADPSFRVLIVTKITDPVLLQHQLGREKARELLNQHSDCVRKHALEYGGRESEHRGDGFVLSFPSATKAVACALAIHQRVSESGQDVLDFRIALHGGEPIEKSVSLFGDTIQLASRLCVVARKSQVVLSSTVRELVAKDYFQHSRHIFSLSPQDEKLLDTLLAILEEHWQTAEFDITDFCRATAMSKSQLYRKTIGLTGVSPNILLKDFRLDRAREMMRKQPYSIAQITFESGFTSPSYFTKCFKKKFGLLPMAYLDQLH
jgi:AraC-like DNA-binding protein